MGFATETTTGKKARPYSAAGKGPSVMRLWCKAAIVAVIFAVSLGLIAFAVFDLLPAPLRWFAEQIMGWQLVLVEFFRLLVFEGADSAQIEVALIPSRSAFAATFGGLTFFVSMGTLMVGRGSLIGRWLPEPPDILQYALFSEIHDSDHPQWLGRPLVGREEEMRRLKRFAGGAGADAPCWITLSGAHGLGKSKLALEWLAALQQSGWDAGVLQPGGTVESVRRAVFRQKTAIIIDEALRIEDDERWAILDTLLSKKGRVRIVLIDQLPVSLPPDTPLNRPMRERIEAAHLEALDQIAESRLAPLDEAALRQIAPEGLDEKTLADAEGRPLYVLLGDDPRRTIGTRVTERLRLAATPDQKRMLAFAALAAPVNVSEQVPHDLTRNVGLADRRRIFRISDHAYGKGLPSLQPRPFADRIFLVWAADVDDRDRDLLIRQAIAANGAAVQGRLASLWTSPIPLEEGQFEILMQAQSLFDELRPDLVAAAHTEAERLVKELSEIMGQVEAANAVAREMSERLPTKSEDNLAKVKVMVATATDAAATPPSEQWESLSSLFSRLSERVEAVLAQLAVLALARSHDDRLLWIYVVSVRDSVYVLGAAKRFAQLEYWIKSLVVAARRDSGCEKAEIRLAEATAMGRAMAAYNDVGQIEHAERWGERLATITHDSLWRKNVDIQSVEAIAAINMIYAYSTWPPGTNAEMIYGVEGWGERLAVVTHNPLWRENADIQFKEAQGAVNATGAYGKAHMFEQVERWGERLAAIAHDPLWRENADIQNMEVQTAFNAMTSYGQAGKLGHMERWNARFSAVTLIPLWRENAKIQEQEAAAAINAMMAYGRVGKFDEMERWGVRLSQVSQNALWYENAEIQLSEADAAKNAMAIYGNAKALEQVERWDVRLTAVTHNPRWLEHGPIQLIEAQAARNGIVAYGKAGALEQVGRWGERLTAVTHSPLWQEYPEIQLEEAEGAFNAIIAYRKADNPDAERHWWARLADVAQRFPIHPEIAYWASQAGISTMFSLDP